MSTFTGARQRKGGAERRENDNQSGASKAANGAVHAEIVPGGKAGRCWLAFKGTCGLMILFGLVVFLVAAVTLQYATMRIHSCEVYFPMKFASFWGASDSLLRYIKAEGFVQILGDVGAIVRSEVMDMAPFPVMKGGLEGRRLLMVGGANTPVAHRRARQLGVAITLLDDTSMINIARQNYVTSFVAIPQFGQVSVSSPEAVMNYILKHMKASGEIYDGVFTLVEDHGPITSFIAKELQLPLSPLESATACRSKFLVREAMRRAKLPVPKYAKISSEGDLSKAAARVGFPAFLKPVFGVQATFAAQVGDLEELKDIYSLFQIDSQHHPIYHHGTEMILESLMHGSEVQLELAVLDGEVVFDSISSEYSSTRDSISFPAQLSEEAQAEMLDLARDTVHENDPNVDEKDPVAAIGLTHGVVHLEMFYDNSTGAQVVEVNNRLSRGFLPQSLWHQLAFSQKSIDYYGAVFAIAAGQVPHFRRRSAAPIHMTMLLKEPSADWWVTDPKDAPNRGWEREGKCGLFLAPAPSWAKASARDFQKRHREDPEKAERETSKENWELAKLAVVSAIMLGAWGLVLLGSVF